MQLPDDSESSWSRSASTTTIAAHSSTDATTIRGDPATPAGSRDDSRVAVPLAWCRRHAVFFVVLLVGIAWRIVTPPAFMPTPAVGGSGSAPMVTAAAAVLDLLGLATGTVVYLLLVRWAVWRWLAALATVPALWDASVLVGERSALPDVMFSLVVAIALLVLCWEARPGVPLALVGGLLFGAATTVQLVGLPLVLAAALFMLLTGATWRGRVAGALVVALGFGVPVLSYGMWYYYVHGEYATTQRQAMALAAYHNLEYMPWPILLGGLLLALLAGAGIGRAGLSGMRAVCLLTAVVPAGVLLGAVGTAELSWHDQQAGLVLWPAAGALGLTALMRGRRAPAADRPQIDEVDRGALATFREHYGEPTLGPVVVVIAAYNEAVGLPRVLSSMPSTVCGLAADVVVVDDGSTDGTVAAARAHGGAYLVTSPANRGQGAAMRLGYRVARDHGARYIITTDADAQYDTADFPIVLAPVLDGSADFVTGSRRLGRQHTVDRFRRTGVYVFAWIVSALTGERLTDTSFGLRAMRSEVTAAVTLNQPQYQSSELLIGAHSHGYRIAEVPGTMHLRAAGSTKKGGNLLYGMRYTRVVLGTWWREGCPAPARERAPAMVGRRDTASGPPSPGR